MRRAFFGMVLAFGLIASGPTHAADYQTTVQPDIVYAEHDGTKLVGDFYLPKGLAKAPVLIAIHGGGWQVGSRASYKYWGPYLAGNGYAVFSIEYRMRKPGTYPASVYDVKAAIQFVRAKAAEFGVDPDRIGLIGDCAGGHLRRWWRSRATSSHPPVLAIQIRPEYSAGVKVRPWSAFTASTTCWRNGSTIRWRGRATRSRRSSRRVAHGPPTQVSSSNSSPISYATVDPTTTKFCWSTAPTTTSSIRRANRGASPTALNQARLYVRRSSFRAQGTSGVADPFEGEPGGYGATVAPRLLRFLAIAL